MLLPSIAHSCSGYVIGFKGKEDVFNYNAFTEYANNLNYCGQTYSWNEVASAAKHISYMNKPYHLYGYSLGAVSVKQILEIKTLRKPKFVITIGAYKTTDVNFNQYNVKYINYFDYSGLGQSSPGVFLNVSHDKIQREVNKIIFNQNK